MASGKRRNSRRMQRRLDPPSCATISWNSHLLQIGTVPPANNVPLNITFTYLMAELLKLGMKPSALRVKRIDLWGGTGDLTKPISMSIFSVNPMISVTPAFPVKVMADYGTITRPPYLSHQFRREQANVPFWVTAPAKDIPIASLTPTNGGVLQIRLSWRLVLKFSIHFASAMKCQELVFDEMKIAILFQDLNGLDNLLKITCYVALIHMNRTYVFCDLKPCLRIRDTVVCG